MVNAVKKAMTMLMPMPERAFIPAGDLVDARHCASFSNPLERAGEFNSVPILTPKLIPLGDCGRITNGNGGSGESRLLAAVRGSLLRTDFEHTLGSRKRTFGAAAERSRLAACAPQIRIFGRGNGIIAMSTSAGQRSGVALPIALMIGGAKIYFIVFGILTIAGGVLGYVKAGSTASIIAGSISGVLLLLAAWLMPEHQAAGLIIALVVSLLLAAQFIPKFFRTFKVMPAGLMSALSAIGIIVAIAAWLRK